MLPKTLAGGNGPLVLGHGTLHAFALVQSMPIRLTHQTTTGSIFGLSLFTVHRRCWSFSGFFLTRAHVLLILKLFGGRRAFHVRRAALAVILNGSRRDRGYFGVGTARTKFR